MCILQDNPSDLSKVALNSTGLCDLATAAFTLPLEKLDAPSLEVFKTRLDEAWNSLGEWKRSLAMAGMEMRYL